MILSLGLSQTLAWGSTYYLPAVLAAPMARDLGLSDSSIFAAFSAALVISALMGPAVGRSIERRGGRDLLAISSLVCAAGLMLLGSAGGPLQLWGAWLVIGIGMALGLYEPAFATLTRLYGRDARSSITGITLIAGFASTLCWPLSAWLEADMDWRNACYTWAAAHLLLGLPLNRLGIPSTDRVVAQPEKTRVAGKESDAGMAMVLLASAFSIVWFISTGMAAHLPRLLQESGLSPAAAIAAAGLVGPAQVAARLCEAALQRYCHPCSPHAWPPWPTPPAHSASSLWEHLPRMFSASCTALATAS
ncbi:MFS transporter [Microbulbifer taiwanensis]|uniref:MFS transporter n=1 Tax=Microbulbifer taiwanensis TaxID=986746 RepID=UPI00361D0EB7